MAIPHGLSGDENPTKRRREDGGATNRTPSSGTPKDSTTGSKYGTTVVQPRDSSQTTLPQPTDINLSVSSQPSDTESGAKPFFNVPFFQMLINVRLAGLRLRGSIPADGNCMFTSISDQIKRIRDVTIPPNVLRRTIANYLRENPHSVHNTHLRDFLDEDWNKYLVSMATTQRWGDHIMLYGAASLFDIEIKVVSSLGKHANQIINAETDVMNNCDVIMLGHVAECHYVSLERSPDGAGVVKTDQSPESGSKTDIKSHSDILMSYIWVPLPRLAQKAVIHHAVKQLISLTQKHSDESCQLEPVIDYNHRDVTVTIVPGNVRIPESSIEYTIEGVGIIRLKAKHVLKEASPSSNGLINSQYVSKDLIQNMPEQLFGQIAEILRRLGMYDIEPTDFTKTVTVTEEGIVVIHDHTTTRTKAPNTETTATSCERSQDGETSKCTNRHEYKRGSEEYVGIEGIRLEFLPAINFKAALYCSAWPRTALSWITRDRSWPNKTVVNDVVKSGFLALPDEKAGNGTDFVISFIKAEELLFQHMNRQQDTCYRVLEELHKSSMPSLTTAHRKHLMLWACETVDCTVWIQNTLVDNIRLVIGILKDSLSEGNYLPHFFLGHVSLFQTLTKENRTTLLDTCVVIMRDPLNALSPKEETPRKYDVLKIPNTLGITVSGKEVLYERQTHQA